MQMWLTIGDYPICGVVGESSPLSITMPVRECWNIYANWLRKIHGQDAILPLRNAKWCVNGQEIDTPDSWHITINGVF